MNFAITGAGWLGVILATCSKSAVTKSISLRHPQKTTIGPSALGAHLNTCLRSFSNQAGLDFSNYIFHVGQRLRIGAPNNNEEFLGSKAL